MINRCSVFLGALAMTAFAIPVAHAAPAVVINPDGLCGMYDGDGNSVTASNTQVVSTQNANGNVTFKCQITGVDNSTGKAVSYGYASTGVMCGINDPVRGFTTTQEWKETVSASGNATLICHSP